MPNQSDGTSVQDNLVRAVQSGLLNARVHDQAQKLLDRLEKPVRLALMGLPGSGKSTLLNLLVGDEVMPEGVRLPTLQLTYGAEEQAICTLPDGAKKVLPIANAQAIAALSPVFVEMQLPLAALKKISVLEVVAPNDANAIHKASQWAAKRADVALWCTNGFNETEQRIWGQMPDTIKDHAFLMMTRMDILQTQGVFDDVRANVTAVATGEFNKILPISTRQALGAKQPDGSVDKDRMRASGGLALISAVLKQVDQGRRSATDMAEVLLLQNAADLAELDAAPAAESPVAEPAPAPTPASSKPTAPVASRPRSVPKEPPMPRPAPRSADETAASVTDGIAKLRTIAARRAEEMVAPPAPDALGPATRDAFSHVVTYLQDRAQELSEQLSEMGEAAPTEVIASAVAHVQWLCDYLNENGDDSDVPLQRARDTAFDAADLVQLMQMEKRDSAALEALSLMLQLKRELQADLAA